MQPNKTVLGNSRLALIRRGKGMQVRGPYVRSHRPVQEQKKKKEIMHQAVE
jgi:hypothetical protein